MADLLASLHHASSTVLECRDFGHAWSWRHDDSITTGRGGRLIEFTRTAECLRCTAVRKQTIDGGDFSVASSNITYPDGYLVDGPRQSRRAARRELFTRITQ